MSTTTYSKYVEYVFKITHRSCMVCRSRAEDLPMSILDKILHIINCKPKIGLINSLLYCDFFPSVGAWVKVGHSLKSTIVFNFCAKNRLGLCGDVCRRETVAEFGSQQRSSHNKTSSTHVRQLIIKILL